MVLVVDVGLQNIVRLTKSLPKQSNLVPLADYCCPFIPTRASISLNHSHSIRFVHMPIVASVSQWVSVGCRCKMHSAQFCKQHAAAYITCKLSLRGGANGILRNAILCIFAFCLLNRMSQEHKSVGSSPAPKAPRFLGLRTLQSKSLSPYPASAMAYIFSLTAVGSESL